jgi:hypothetical protein
MKWCYIYCLQQSADVELVVQNCLESRKIPNFKVLKFSTFYVLSTSVQNGALSENNIFCFYKATFGYFINWGETAKFDV